MIAIGTTVRLRGGSKLMTVTFCSEPGQEVQCDWHDEDGVPWCECYPRAALWVDQEAKAES
jgi:uncharacterized protein YodC (DUF2158 family)